MKQLAMLAVAAAAVWGCKRDEPPPAPAQAPAAAPAPAANDPAAPVADHVRLAREADAALQTGDVEKAIAGAEAALAIRPTDVLANNLLGRAAAKRFETSKDPIDAQRAIDAFERAAQADPGFWPAWQNVGELYEKKGEGKRAAAAYQKVLAAQPDHPDKARFQAVIDSVK